MCLSGRAVVAIAEFFGFSLMEPSGSPDTPVLCVDAKPSLAIKSCAAAMARENVQQVPTEQQVMQDSSGTAPVVICGAGIGGLVLAMALHRKCNLAASDIEVFEQAKAFTDSAGGGIGLYANGLRVLRSIDPELLARVRAAGYDYIYRRWFRHDGTEVACAREDALVDETELQSIGIRRWKLQKALLDHAKASGITVRFNMRTEAVTPLDNGAVEVKFADGTTRTARVVFGADGLKSKVREAVVGPLAAEFTGVTCLMGAAKVPRPVRGICFPSSSTTKNHACYYPTGNCEQIFQLYFPAETKDEAWGTLSPEEGRRECAELAEKLEADGWDAAFLAPLKAAESVIRVGLFSREPLDSWACASGRIILLGDAAHPPVPYIGQGAMMAMEDVGVLSLMLQHFCCAGGFGPFDPTADNLTKATELYQAMRIPRTRHVLGSSHTLGKTQQQRANSWLYNVQREWTIRLQVALYGTLPIMKPGAMYDFANDVASHVEAAENGVSVEELIAPAPPPEGKTTQRVLAGVGAVAAVATLVAVTRRR